MVAVINVEIEVLTQKIDRMSDYVADRSIENMRNIDLYYLKQALFYRLCAWSRTALEQIKNSGALR